MFAALWALLAKQEDEEQMIKEAEPMQSRQEQLSDVCRAVDMEIAATTSAVEDDRTTPVTETANILASELGRGIPNRGGGVRLAGRGTSKSRAQPEDSLPRGVKLMAAWRKLSLLSSDKRT